MSFDPLTAIFDLGKIAIEKILPDPAAGGFTGLICTTAGTPGTWKTFGAITA